MPASRGPSGRRQLSFRGTGLLEDSPLYGAAIDNTARGNFIAEAKAMGSTFIRSQYPLHPYLEDYRLLRHARHGYRNQWRTG